MKKKLQKLFDFLRVRKKIERRIVDGWIPPFLTQPMFIHYSGIGKTINLSFNQIVRRIWWNRLVVWSWLANIFGMSLFVVLAETKIPSLWSIPFVEWIIGASVMYFMVALGTLNYTPEAANNSLQNLEAFLSHFYLDPSPEFGTMSREEVVAKCRKDITVCLSKAIYERRLDTRASRENYEHLKYVAEHMATAARGVEIYLEVKDLWKQAEADAATAYQKSLDYEI